MSQWGIIELYVIDNQNIDITCDSEDVKMKFVERSQCKYNWPKMKRRNQTIQINFEREIQRTNNPNVKGCMQSLQRISGSFYRNLYKDIRLQNQMTDYVKKFHVETECKL